MKRKEAPAKHYACSSEEEDEPPATELVKRGDGTVAPDGTGVDVESRKSNGDGESSSLMAKNGGGESSSVMGNEGDCENTIGEGEGDSENTLGEREGVDGVSETEEPAKRGERNPDDEEYEMESDEDEGTLAYLPEEMYIKPEFYNKSMKIATNCFIEEAVRNLEEILDAEELEWFHDHPQFCHFFHMTREVNHKTMGFYLLLIRTAKIKKEKEVWFIVNGVAIRYSMHEHALISGLDCSPLPDDYEKVGNLDFVTKHFKGKVKCTDAEVKKKFLSMRKYSKDRLQMAILYFLTAVIKGNAKRGDSAPLSATFLRRVVTDPEYCKTFPWGRYTFLDNLKEIKKLLRRMNGKVDKKHVTFPGFILSLELLAFEAIPALMMKFREKEDEERLGCPRMCKTRFQHCSGKGWPVSDLYQEIGETKDIDSILFPTEDEKELLSELFDPEEEDDLIDVVADSWNTRLKEGRCVWFKDLCEVDIRCREAVAIPDKPAKRVLDSSTPKQTTDASVVEELKEVKEELKEVKEELKEVKEELSDALKKIDEMGLRQADLDKRFEATEELVVQLSGNVGKEVMIIPPETTHTDNMSVGETTEKKRNKKKKKDQKADDEVLEDITPEVEDKGNGESKAPEKKRNKKKNEKKGDADVLEDITPEEEDKQNGESKAPEKKRKTGPEQDDEPEDVGKAEMKKKKQKLKRLSRV